MLVLHYIPIPTPRKKGCLEAETGLPLINSMMLMLGMITTARRQAQMEMLLNGVEQNNRNHIFT